jgi:hypothetical protein
MAQLVYTQTLVAGTPENVNDLNTNLNAIALSVNNVESSQIVDGNVGSAEIASNAVTTAKILDANVTNAKLASAAAAWTAFTPTWTNTTTNPVIGNGSIAGYYSQIGRVVNFRVTIVCGSTTTYGTGTNYFFTYPVAASANIQSRQPTCAIVIYDATSTGQTLYTGSHDAGSVRFLGRAHTATALFNATGPYTLVSGSSIHISGTYESAA